MQLTRWFRMKELFFFFFLAKCPKLQKCFFFLNTVGSLSLLKLNIDVTVILFIWKDFLHLPEQREVSRLDLVSRGHSAHPLLAIVSRQRSVVPDSC